MTLNIPLKTTTIDDVTMSRDRDPVSSARVLGRRHDSFGRLKHKNT